MSAIISDPSAFAQLCGELARHSAFCLDTEFMRERTYFAQLCLLQLSFGEQAVCIDTLALPDLSPLRATMASPAIGKVLHAARQDLEVLWPATGPVVGLFDTQVAAALIGLPAQVGYGDLVKQLLAKTCIRPKRAPTGRGGRSAARSWPTRWTMCATCSRCASA
jgi:ribonuclease D